MIDNEAVMMGIACYRVDIPHERALLVTDQAKDTIYPKTINYVRRWLMWLNGTGWAEERRLPIPIMDTHRSLLRYGYYCASIYVVFSVRKVLLLGPNKNIRFSCIDSLSCLCLV